MVTGLFRISTTNAAIPLPTCKTDCYKAFTATRRTLQSFSYQTAKLLNAHLRLYQSERFSFVTMTSIGKLGQLPENRSHHDPQANCSRVNFIRSDKQQHMEFRWLRE